MHHAFGRLVAVQAFYCHWDCDPRAKFLGLTEASRREREPEMPVGNPNGSRTLGLRPIVRTHGACADSPQSGLRSEQGPWSSPAALRYRRPDLDTLEDFEGNGVSYWASPIEAQACAGEEVALVGGETRRAKPLCFLAPSVKRLHLVARRDLTETMSAYLVERIASLSNVELHVGVNSPGYKGSRAACSARRSGQERRSVPRTWAAPSLSFHRRRSQHCLAGRLRRCR